MAYQRLLERNPNHSKGLMQLTRLWQQSSSSFGNQDTVIEYLEKSIATGE